MKLQRETKQVIIFMGVILLTGFTLAGVQNIVEKTHTQDTQVEAVSTKEEEDMYHAIASKYIAHDYQEVIDMAEKYNMKYPNGKFTDKVNDRAEMAQERLDSGYTKETESEKRKEANENSRLEEKGYIDCGNYLYLNKESITKGYSSSDFVKLQGELINRGEKARYVEIEFEILDADGNVIGTSMDNITNLSEGATWKFETIGSVNGRASSYRIANVEARR